MKKLIVLTLCTSLVACTTTDLFNPNNLDKTGAGVGIGAIGGALGGLLLSKGGADTRNKVLIGAGIGALIGGSVGIYMDSQEKELRKELDNSGIIVTRDGDKIIISLPSNISFPSGKSAVLAEFHPPLNAIAKVLAKYNKTILDVSGHTDSVGTDSSNQILSEQRALSVGNYISAKNIDGRRMHILGFGESQPIASNSSASGRAANRRVEIAILPLVKK